MALTTQEEERVRALLDAFDSDNDWPVLNRLLEAVEAKGIRGFEDLKSETVRARTAAEAP